MQSQIDPHTLALSRKDSISHTETRAKISDWTWKSYQRSDTDADAALDALIAQLRKHHAGARAIVANARPATTSYPRRPASRDEEEC